jgi:hypothetical protein
MGGVLRVTVIVKASFSLSEDGDAQLVEPVPIVTRDHHRDPVRPSSIDAASETAPFLPSAGVLLTGHARAPAGQPVAAMVVRLGVFRDGPLLDKALHVFGERTAGDPESPRPFEAMPLAYERTYGGPALAENPVGIGAAADARFLPNLLDQLDPERPVGFGPISRHWPPRKGRLGAAWK